MTEPTAEHLKAAQEWIEGNWQSNDADPTPVQSFEAAVESLAALLARREQALREEITLWQHRSTTSARDSAALEQRAEAAEARLKRVIEAAGEYLDPTHHCEDEGEDFSQPCPRKVRLDAALAAAQSSEEGA